MQKKGFTLIELLVVVAIIGLLSSVVLSSLNNARINARSARRISDLREMQKAVETYYTDNGSYPSTSGSFWFDCYTDKTRYSNYIPAVVPKYISVLPHDPGGNCMGNKDYNYGYASDGKDYKLIIVVPNSGTFENCSYGVSHNIQDPLRTCTAGDKAWSLYTAGGANW